MNILLVSPIITREFDSGKYILKALGELGHFVSIWDYRLEPNKKDLPKCDLTIVNKGEGIDVDSLPGLKALWYPDYPIPEKEVTSKYDKVFIAAKVESEFQWLPGAYDYHVHLPLSVKKTVETLYIGSNTTERKRKFIEEIDPDIVVGNGWSGVRKSYCPMYGLSFSMVVNTAKIAIDIHSVEVGVNRKLFELIPCVFTLVDRVTGVEEILGRVADKVCFDTPEECNELIDYYLDNEEERQLVWVAEKEAIFPYTYENQVEKILEAMW